MKILFLNPSAQLGGAERVLLDMIACLRRHDAAAAAEITVVLLEDGPLVERAKHAGAHSVQVRPMPRALATFGESGSGELGRIAFALRAVRAFPSLFSYTRTLKRLIVEINPDIVHSNGIKTHVISRLAVPAGSRAKLVWHIHDFLGRRRAMARVLRRFAGRTSVALAISEAVARDAREALPRTNIKTLLNAIDVEHFSPGPGDGARLDQLAGFKPASADVVRVGLVATYANWKGHDVFLDAAARVTNPSVRVYIVGGPIYATTGSQFSREELEARATKMGVRDRVGFVAFQSDPRDVYRALDVVVHASTKPEPFGRTIVEAMACGRATIVSAAGGAVELFEDDVDAIGVRPGDAAALAVAIERLAGDHSTRQRLGATSVVNVRRRFSLDRIGPALLSIYGNPR